MKLCYYAIVLILFFTVPAAFADAPVSLTVESSLKTNHEFIRQFVFDGSATTSFRSAAAPTPTDHLTLRFDRDIELNALKIKTGDPEVKESQLAADIELSADGVEFSHAGALKNDVLTWKESQPKGRVIAIRLKPTSEQKKPIIVREIELTSVPALAPYRYPIEIEPITADAPELKEWTEKTAMLCEKWYPIINEYFASEGYKPVSYIKMTIDPKYKGVAEAGGNRIKGATKWFKDHPEDVGAMIHETTHVVQRYRGRNPGWLVEGVADYFRFFVFEPGKIGRIGRDPHYNQAYRTTAAFLAFVLDKYDKDLVKKLNRAMREGTYKDDMFKDLTGKTLPELDEEWRTSLGIKK